MWADNQKGTKIKNLVQAMSLSLLKSDTQHLFVAAGSSFTTFDGSQLRVFAVLTLFWLQSYLSWEVCTKRSFFSKTRSNKIILHLKIHIGGHIRWQQYKHVIFYKELWFKPEKRFQMLTLVWLAFSLAWMKMFASSSTIWPLTDDMALLRDNYQSITSKLTELSL